ncbi:MAG: MotA/TolQ/ExbB proton channel family protein [Bdellovibrionales bacterium]|nr:MotA/TolQ/ExbB proton channel family protein [Bdellovibrionales bacterium]
MTLFPIGLLVAIIALAAAIYELKQSAANFYDFVALAVVFGGTFAVALMVLPWDLRREVFRAFRMLFYKRATDARAVVRSALSIVQNPSAPQIEAGVPELATKILKEGAELIQLGLGKDRIDEILQERVFQTGRRRRRVGTAIRNLAKYPPAFGLMGTVLGLVNLMRGLASGLSAQQTGLEMAVALVATMYGLLLANLFINPAGEMVMKKATEDEDAAEIALEAVMLAYDRVSILEAQEVLNSYVDERYRIDMVGGLMTQEGAEAQAA